MQKFEYTSTVLIIVTYLSHQKITLFHRSHHITEKNGICHVAEKG